MQLYTFPFSSSAWRVRIVVAHKALDVEAVHVDISATGDPHAQQAFTAVNPLGQVPVLAFTEGGVVHRIAQSVAICEFLEERFPTPPLLPPDAPGRARVREMVQLINAGVQPLQNNRVLAAVDDLGGDSTAWARHFVGRGLRALEQTARHTAGRYLHGDDLTLADVFLVPQLFNARRFGVPLSGLETLVRVDAACADLPAFTAARPV